MDETKSNVKVIETVPDLLEVWKEKHFAEGKDRFIFDGCADYDKYSCCLPKIMIILKEGYFEEEDCNIPERKGKPWV